MRFLGHRGSCLLGNARYVWALLDFYEMMDFNEGWFRGE